MTQEALKKERKVTVYSTDTWPWCRRAKEYLSQKGIAYTEINVAKNRDAAKEMIQKSGQMGVPVIMIDNDIVVGFNQKQIDDILAK